MNNMVLLRRQFLYFYQTLREKEVILVEDVIENDTVSMPPMRYVSQLATCYVGSRDYNNHPITVTEAVNK